MCNRVRKKKGYVHITAMICFNCQPDWTLVQEFTVDHTYSWSRTWSIRTLSLVPSMWGALKPNTAHFALRTWPMSGLIRETVRNKLLRSVGKALYDSDTELLMVRKMPVSTLTGTCAKVTSTKSVHYIQFLLAGVCRSLHLCSIRS